MLIFKSQKIKVDWMDNIKKGFRVTRVEVSEYSGVETILE
jgi:hypothetical protein